MRIAIYSRKSVETDTGESIKNQIKLCQEYFEKHYNDCTFEIFEDEGFSGGNTNRPAFQRMMELVKKKQFDVVAVYKIDRIARNIVDFVNIYDELEKLNVKLVSVTEGFDPNTPAGKMMMLLLASFAEMERMSIAQRVKDNMRELAKMGRWSGGTPPTGYTTRKVEENGKIVTYLQATEELANIKTMFEMYAEGYTTYEISKYFKTQGINYPRKTIYNILINPTYLISSPQAISYLQIKGYTVFGEPNGYGFLPYNRRPRIKGKKLWNDKTKFVGVSKHEAIIDIDLWMKVQERMEEFSSDPRPRESQFSFLSGGIVKCICGASMFIEGGRIRKDGTRTFYYRCSRRCGKNKFLKLEDAEREVTQFLKELLDKKILEKYINTGKKISNYADEIKRISKKISSNETIINNLLNNFGMVTGEAAKVVAQQLEKIAKENKNLKEQLLHLERLQMLEQTDNTSVDILHEQIVKFFDELELEEKRRVIKTIIDQIIWDGNKRELKIKLVGQVQ